MSNRTYEKSLFLKKNFKNLNIIKWNDFSKEINKFDIIINATSLGLNTSDEFNSDFSNFKKNMVYIDTIYNPAETKMIKYFKSNKIRTSQWIKYVYLSRSKSFLLME